MSNWIARGAQTCAQGLCLIPFLAATPDGWGCPNEGVTEVPISVTYGPTTRCDTGIGFDVKGVKVSWNAPPPGTCPLWVVITPPHHKPTKKVGYRTRPGKLLSVMKYNSQCRDRYLFWFIALSSRCESTTSEVMSTLQDYVQITCDTTDGDEHGDGGDK